MQNLRFYFIRDKMNEIDHRIDFIFISRVAHRSTTWTLRRSLSIFAVCNVSRKSPGTNPECEMRRFGKWKDKRYGEWERGSRTNTSTTNAVSTRLSGHVQPTIQLSRDIWAARRVSGFVFFEAFNDTLHGPPELYESLPSIHARGYNLLLVKWIQNKVSTSN